MEYRFAGFELDQERRELRLNGREIPLQPRVFDVLRYLVENRDRVVSKDELLDALWPDMVVTEGSLQRAVSLARSALKQGGLQAAIRTFSRQGYRFCHQLASDLARVPPSPAPAGLDEARSAYGRGDWAAAAWGFAEADDRARGLAGDDLERWAYAVFCTGKIAGAVTPLERAVAAHAMGGDVRSAARAAQFLSHVQFEQGEFAVARGWHQRAASLLASQPACRETALQAAIDARFEFADSRMQAAERLASGARDLGRRMNEPDVEAVSLLYAGLACLSMGDVRAGTSRLDEAAALVIEGRVHPLIAGSVYCGVVWGYRNLADWGRAGQWIDRFTRWCAASGLATYSGSCSLHRAEVLGFRGRVEEAEAAVNEACRLLPENSPRLAGEAYRVMGDLHLARGRLDEAEAAFRKAHALGHDPQPGYAALLLCRGEPDAAVCSLERSLDDPGWASRQRRGLLLAHLAIAAVAAGRPGVAHEALDELESAEGIHASPALAALRARGWAEVAFAEGHLDEAVANLRRAVDIWLELDAPFYVAAGRRRMADLLAAQGDDSGAKLELAAAAMLPGDAASGR